MGRGLATAIEGLTVCGAGTLLIFGGELGQRWTPGLCAATVALSFCNALRREWNWRRRLRLVSDLARQVRRGEAPIGELSDIKGPMAPLAEEIAGICRDLGLQRVELGEMRETLRQAIAHRTSSLERTIGSLRRQASLDALTGLLNRRALELHLPMAMERCRATGANLGVMMIDVDHFKHLNDTRGHPAGDQYLRNIGQIIRSTVRESDAAFRYGGDEFLIVLEGVAADAGAVLAKRLVSLADALGRTMRVSPTPRLSLGQAWLVDHPRATAQDLVGRADEALYEVKKARKCKGADPMARAAG